MLPYLKSKYKMINNKIKTSYVLATQYILKLNNNGLCLNDICHNITNNTISNPKCDVDIQHLNANKEAT